MHVRAVLLIVVVGAARCDCGEDIRELVPDIDVAPTEVALSQQVVGREVTVTVQVGNRGNGVLDLTRAHIDPDDVGFTLDDPPAEVDPGKAVDLTVRFVPASRAPVEAVLVLESNDPDEERVEVPLSGSGGAPALVVDPLVLDFGLVNEDATSELFVTLTNTGFDAVADLTATLALDVFEVVSAPERIEAGDVGQVVVRFAPVAATALLEDEDGVIEDTLTLNHADGEETVRVRGEVNLKPIALAVEQITGAHEVKVGVGKPVVIDGSGSSDPEGEPLTFAWALPARPDGSATALVGQGDPTVRLTPDAVGTYEVLLEVRDPHGASSQDTVRLLPRDLEIVLTWRAAAEAPCQENTPEECALLPPNERDDVCCGQSDLDLHVIRPSGTLGDVGSCPVECEDAFCAEFTDENPACRQTGTDCCFENVAPEWNMPGRADDPRLDVDDVQGEGPEIVSLNSPEDGTYRAVVIYCLDRIGEPSEASLTVYVEGELQSVVGPMAMAEGEMWTALNLLRSDGTWTFVPGVVESAPAGLCD